MKPHQTLLEHAGMPLDALPDEIRERIESNAAWKAEMEKQADTARLLQLKNYETPDEALFGRIHHRVQIQLQVQQQEKKVPVFYQLPSWARMVAVVVVMLGLSVLTHREMLRAPEADQAVIAAPAQPPTDSFYTYPIGSSDSFTTYVLAPPGLGSEDFTVSLTRQLEADFEALGLPETNLLETTSLLPVMLPVGR